MISFVLGNGKSRLDFNIDAYKQYGPMYGCNAIYRDAQVDYLIGVDPPMVQEIIDNKAHLSTKFYTREHKRFAGIPGVNFTAERLGWSSGPTALWLASSHKPNAIIIVGFDYQSADEKLNNIYGSTKNYKDKNAPATYFGNWVRQTQLIIRDNPDVKYYRLITHEHKFTPRDILKYPNFSNISKEKLDDFLQMAQKEPISTHISVY
jgi:hypothetical protein